jgi:hypothetical protein
MSGASVFILVHSEDGRAERQEHFDDAMELQFQPCILPLDFSYRREKCFYLV